MKMLTFIEVGSAHYGALTPLLDQNWHQNALKVIEDGSENRFPAELLSYDGEWEGYFVEPTPARLAHLVEEKRFSKNAHCIQGALAAESIFIEMPIIGRAEMPSATLKFYHNTKIHYKVILQTFTLDDLLDFLDFTPTLLFMDVEGVEQEVLDTYSFSRCPEFWMVDMHQSQRNIMKSINIFEEKGYQILTTKGHPKDQDELWVQLKE